jgi:hypothetical protein
VATYYNAPTTSGIANVSVNEGVSSQYVSLSPSFQDDQIPSDQLAYSVVGDTNPSLFDSLILDGMGGLTFYPSPGVAGDSQLTIRATDYGGLFVETAFNVHINDKPTISFGMSNSSGSIWTISGTATDQDDDVAGMVVAFGGVLSGFDVTATVQPDGTFTVTAELIGLQTGMATAQTVDPEGAESNVAEFYVLNV